MADTMAEKRAGGILASSFVAGVLLAAAIFAPTAWEPVPGPYFGLDDAAPISGNPVAVHDADIVAAHAELSARAQAAQPPVFAVGAAPATPSGLIPPSVATAGDPAAVSPQRDPANAVVEEPRPDAGQPARVAVVPVVHPPASTAASALPVAAAAAPPERVAVVDGSPAALAALAQTLPPPAPPPAAQPSSSPPGAAAVDTAASAADKPAAPADEPPKSLTAMVNRMRAAQPAASRQAAPPAVVAVPQAEPQQPTARSWSRTFADGGPDDAGSRPAAQPRPFAATAAAGSLGAAPLPGGPWTDPDAANWSEIPAAQPAGDATRRRGWLTDRDAEARTNDDGSDQRAAKPPIGGRLFERLRGTERRVARVPDAAEGVGAVDVGPPDIGRWPRPIRLEQQFDHLASLASAAGPAGASLVPWVGQTRTAIAAVMETRGPRDAAADSSLVALGEHVLSGMSLADTAADSALASHTRRAALAVARRVAVWRATAALFPEIHRSRDFNGDHDAATAMTRQAADRAIAEIARLLDAIERFEVEASAPDALVVKSALGSISGFYPTAAHALVRAVEDHYVAPNVRIAVHQTFLEKMLPGAAVDTAPFQDVVMGREVRGTRRVERTTTLRLVPDDDEISFNLEVHGDIASRSTTESGPVSVTARSASAFTVRKPIKISSQGLLFGNAAGVASNRSHVDTIQTSFDAMPMMGSLVRNIAKNQQAEAMPEANREVIDKIVSRACREVDSQSEPQFAELANRVRDRVWMPLVNLGLEPKAVALETSSSLATMRLRLAASTQLAAHTPRPRAPSDAMLSMQVHESSVNNVVERLELDGRRLSLEELIRMVCAKVGAEPRIPEELPEGVAVAFAAVQPLRVECRDGLVHVRVKLDAIESGRRDWVDIVAHVAYRPVCRGAQVFLEREGPIRLSGPGHEGRMELALRTIFGKIFPKERPIAILPEHIAANPRLAGAQAVQAASSDGWFAITLEQTAVAQPAAQPAAQRAAESRRKVIFR